MIWRNKSGVLYLIFLLMIILCSFSIGIEKDLLSKPDNFVLNDITNPNKIINITKAFLVEESNITNIFDQVSIRDNIWYEFKNNSIVNVKFEKNLTNNDDITIYAKGTGSIEIYDGIEYVDKFENINGDKLYKKFLTNLDKNQDTFNLKIIGNISIDLIIDPQIIRQKEIGVFGKKQDINTSWTYVEFKHTFDSVPVVVHSTEIDGFNYEGASGGNGDPVCLTRISNVTESGFYVRLDDWDNRASFDDACPSSGASGINVNYMAMEIGTHYLSDNATYVEVRNISRAGGSTCGSKSDWVHAENNMNFIGTYSSTPYVFASVQSAYDNDEINTYITGCSGSEYDNTCAQIGLSGMEPANTVCNDHGVNEDVGVIIFGIDSSQENNPDNGQTNNASIAYKWSMVRSSDEVAGATNDPSPMSAYPTSYDSTFGNSVTLIVAPIRVDGADGFVPIFDLNEGSDLTYLLSMEDENLDDEQSHTAEPLKFIAFNDTFGYIFSNETLDIYAPNRTNTNATTITANSAVISWYTDEFANSSVTYANSSVTGLLTENNDFVTLHAIALMNLAPNTTYFYNVTSCDNSGNCITDSQYNFTTTLTPDLTPPTIINVLVNNIQRYNTKINWSTNEPANSLIKYGTTTNLSQNESFGLYVDSHELTLSGLTEGTTYYYNITSCDAANNCNTTGYYNFTTLINYVSTATINSPYNESRYIIDSIIPLNITINDDNNDSMCIEIKDEDTDSLYYYDCNLINQDIIYEWTAPSRVDDSDIYCLYHFDELDEYGELPNYVNDFGGNCNDATCTTCPTHNKSAGKFAGAYYYDGNNDYFDMGATSVFDNAFTDKTVEVWFNPDAITGTSKRTIYEEGGATNGLNMYIYDGSVYAGAWCENCAPAWQGNWLSFTATANEWHYLALIFDGNNEMTVVYDNQTQSISLATAMNSHTGGNFIGSNGDTKFHDGDDSTDGDYFTGYIDEFVVYWEKALTIAEAKNHYRLQKGKYNWSINISDQEDYTLYYNNQFIIDDTSNVAAFDQDDIGTFKENSIGYFYANFTNFSYNTILNAECNITFNTLPKDSISFGPFNMTYNVTSLLYEFTTSFETPGTYNYNISCANQEYEAESTEQVSISSNSNPEFELKRYVYDITGCVTIACNKTGGTLIGTYTDGEQISLDNTKLYRMTIETEQVSNGKNWAIDPSVGLPTRETGLPE